MIKTNRYYLGLISSLTFLIGPDPERYFKNTIPSFTTGRVIEKKTRNPLRPPTFFLKK